MQTQLAETLVKYGIIQENIEVCAKYKAKGLGPVDGVSTQGNFMIRKVGRSSTGQIVFVLTNIKDGNVVKVLPESIIGIDGMDPSRFAKVYNINPDGTIREKGKKRGRKTKLDRVKTSLLTMNLKIDPCFVWEKDFKDNVMNEIFPESSNEHPSTIPDATVVLDILNKFNIPVMDSNIVTEEEMKNNLFSWNDDGDDSEDDDDFGDD